MSLILGIFILGLIRILIMIYEWRKEYKRLLKDIKDNEIFKDIKDNKLFKDKGDINK